MDVAVFFISAAIILGGGVGVIVARNPVHSALSLVATLFGVAVIFIDLEAYFLAAVQVIVYAGAIVVLFLFVIMLVGVDKAENVSVEPIIRQRQFAMLAAAGMVIVAVLVGIAFSGTVTGQPQNADLEISRAVENADGTTTPPSTSNVRQLAEALFTDYVFAFEITALLLTIAVVGAVILARRPTGELETLPDVEPSWALVPEPEPPADVGEDTESDDDPAPDEDAARAEATASDEEGASA